MRFIAVILLGWFALTAFAWERIPYTTTWLRVHERVKAKECNPFEIKIATGDTTNFIFFKSEVSHESNFDFFNRNFVTFSIGHNEIVDSTMTFPMYDDDRKTGGLSYRLSLFSPGRVKFEFGESKPLFTYFIDSGTSDIFFEIKSMDSSIRHEVEIDSAPDIEKSVFSSISELENYFQNNKSDIEGVWTHYDQVSPSLRVSGKTRYTIAVVKNENDGYDMIFLNAKGDNINKIWQPLTIKGRFNNAGFEGIYNLQWLDMYGRPVDTDATAQLTGDNLLTLRFPYWETTVRYVKIK